jgi:hypothetical protein
LQPAAKRPVINDNASQEVFKFHSIVKSSLSSLHRFGQQWPRAASLYWETQWKFKKDWAGVFGESAGVGFSFNLRAGESGNFRQFQEMEFGEIREISGGFEWNVVQDFICQWEIGILGYRIFRRFAVSVIPAVDWD